MAHLVVAKNRLPYPPVTGTDVVTYNLLRALASRHDVTLVSLITSDEQRQYAPAFEGRGVRLVPVKMPNKANLASRAAYKLLYGAAAGLTASPLALWYYNPPNFRRAVREACAGADLLQCEYWYLYPTARAVHGIKKVLLKHDAEFNANRRFLATIADPLRKSALGLRYLRRRHYEKTACRYFDEVLCLSGVDAGLVARWTRRAPRVVFPVVDLPPAAATCRGAESGEMLYFGGVRRAANRQGLERFLREIYPCVKAAVPRATLTIRSEPPPRALRRLAAADPSITLLPTAPDITGDLVRAAVAVVPLWVGSGIKIKILTALAHGLPVVTTPVGAEGIPAEEGAELLVGETADELVAALTRLLTDGEAWRRLSEGGRRFAARELDPAVRNGPIAELYAELASSP
jgi:glycosyltransferase involved in cell wall biosynthesis